MSLHESYVIYNNAKTRTQALPPLGIKFHLIWNTLLWNVQVSGQNHSKYALSHMVYDIIFSSHLLS